VRLHELSKELEADSKRMLAIAKELGLGVKSHSSNLPKGTEGILRAAWAEELLEQEEKAARKAKKAKKAKAAEEDSAPEGDASEAAEDSKVAAAVAADDERGSGNIAVTLNIDAPTPEVVEDAAGSVSSEQEEAESEPVVVGDAVEASTDASEAAAGDKDAVVAEATETEVIEVAPVDGADEEAPASGVDADADEDDERHVVVTFGGQAGPSDEEDEAPSEDEPTGESAGPDARPDAEDATETPAAVETIGVPNVPDRVERRGAKILGKIDLSPAEEEPRRRASGAPAYDPLDPTRALPAAKRETGQSRRSGDADRGQRGRSGKPGSGDFVFDPEDNTALSAIRLGHFAGRRRSPPRRPPPRRSRFGRSRRPARNVPRPTHPIAVRAPIAVRELSEELGIKAREILSYFPETFDPRDKNVVLNEEQLLELAVALEREITILPPDSAEGRMLDRATERAKKMGKGDQPRPVVVAVMGHVDHGKTTLLDSLRKSRIAAKEAGGITQKTSAYSVSTKDGSAVTFLDTPGHKAFTEMRSRGAQVTDVALLIVAADDGVMEQTQEAIDHANAADVPMVVAINKCDRPSADPMKVRQQLASAGVLVEDYGGEVGVVECSATTGDGLDALLERLALETELLELNADPGVPARGVVIDSSKDSKLGIVAMVVVQSGTLRAKDPIIAGTSVGRVRWLLDDRGKRISEAGPSMPVQVVGFEEPPAAGARFLVADDINTVREVAAERKEDAREERTPASDAITLENLFDTIDSQGVTEINVLLKADNMGSVDVVRQTVEDVNHPEVRFKVLRTGVGGITEDDVLLASASDAFIIGFGVVPDKRARAAIQRTGVDVKFYDVIYEITEDLEKAVEGELGFESHEEIIGHATIRATFKASKYGTIAGCYVTDGILTRECRVRLVRDGSVIHTGALDSLKRFKDDVKEVRENYECGLHLSGYNDIKEEDVLEAFTVVEVKRTLESTSKG
jgi:translation initiation factor IF-2